jgi:transcriptional regulator with XRE-family HTH domain
VNNVLGRSEPTHQSLVDARHLALRVIARRHSLGLSQRQAAKAIGVSGSTLSRVESGGHLPHREPFLRIARWLGVSLELAAEPEAGARVAVHSRELSTEEAVELHVRDDPRLSTADADALIESFRVIYERLARRRAGE